MDDFEGFEFAFEDGNYACDCNRALFFARAGHEEEPNNLPCGDTRFKVTILNNTGDEVLYAEDLD